MPTETGYNLSPLARLDLEDIWTYTRRQWSRRQADTYVREIVGAFVGLAEGIRIGQSAEDIRPGYLKYRVGEHFIFYRRASTGLQIIRVLHGSMDIPARLNP
jgi:toxin ParE1/3/4